MLQKMKNRLKDQRGLTLIELLAVIVILGIIAAIAVPSIMNVIDKSKEDAVRSDAIQILNSAKLYAASENVDAGNISWEDLRSYVDIDLGDNDSVTDGGGSGDNTFIATVNGSTITLTGTIVKGGKTLTLTNAGLEEIQTAEFGTGTDDDDSSTVVGE